jgi:hypothetical protein
MGRVIFELADNHNSTTDLSTFDQLPALQLRLIHSDGVRGKNTLAPLGRMELEEIDIALY